MRNLILLISILSFTVPSIANYETLTLETFEKVSDFILSNVNEKETLVVFDIDRTLLDTVDCIDDDEEFSNGFFKFEAGVNRCAAEVTSYLAPVLIEELKTLSVPVMALTARRDKILKGTLEQLEDRLYLSYDDNETTQISFETAPLYSNRKKTIHFEQPGKKGILEKTLVIKRGVAMASGSNKGLALQAFLESAQKNNLNYEKIIFVDDDKRNISNLEKAFANTSDFISIIHYTEHSK